MNEIRSTTAWSQVRPPRWINPLPSCQVDAPRSLPSYPSSSTVSLPLSTPRNSFAAFYPAPTPSRFFLRPRKTWLSSHDHPCPTNQPRSSTPKSNKGNSILPYKFLQLILPFLLNFSVFRSIVSRAVIFLSRRVSRGTTNRMAVDFARTRSFASRREKVDRGNSGSNVLDGISIWLSTRREEGEMRRRDGTAGRYEADCVPCADPESSSFFSRALGRRRVTTLNRHRANDWVEQCVKNARRKRVKVDESRFNCPQHICTKIFTIFRNSCNLASREIWKLKDRSEKSALRTGKK